ncbi:transposase [Chryseobacterium sp. T16E-39]|uniref:transposase n=1 Tax=Chryseobacterium sp. T16E-39 TaxID=2015076 RepID=UPI000B5B2403|nr:transposase [Chryseobacterium sp. T16E-39]ASK32322.1 transposase [Chryseobacterium sp. T16E-39]
MNNNFKDIHIGNLIKKRTSELKIKMPRICNFLKTNENEINKMYLAGNINTEILLKWSKLLEYDFFRIYSQHLILYSPPAKYNREDDKVKKVSKLPKFRKSIYTVEIIYFILELIETGEKTKQEVIEDYRIPKTTLYKWISKYKDRK